MSDPAQPAAWVTEDLLRSDECPCGIFCTSHVQELMMLVTCQHMACRRSARNAKHPNASMQNFNLCETLHFIHLGKMMMLALALHSGCCQR